MCHVSLILKGSKWRDMVLVLEEVATSREDPHVYLLLLENTEVHLTKEFR